MPHRERAPRPRPRRAARPSDGTATPSPAIHWAGQQGADIRRTLHATSLGPGRWRFASNQGGHLASSGARPGRCRSLAGHEPPSPPDGWSLLTSRRHAADCLLASQLSSVVLARSSSSRASAASRRTRVIASFNRASGSTDPATDRPTWDHRLPAPCGWGGENALGRGKGSRSRSAIEDRLGLLRDSDRRGVSSVMSAAPR